MRFTIVTPTFERPEFLEATLHSVLSQSGQFELEYIVQDGGSNKTLLDILEGWQIEVESPDFNPVCKSLSFAHFVEPDSGMYDAINRGFSKGDGDVMAWLNSDDIYFPGCLATVRQIFEQNRDIDWLVGQTACVNSEGAVTYTEKGQKAISREFVRRGYYRADLPSFNWLPQDAMFWRRSLWEKAGPLDASKRLVADFKLWQAFAEFAEPVKVDSLLGAYRQHGHQLTADPDAYKKELGPPPRLPPRVKIACGFGWALPQFPRIFRKLPGKSYIPRLLGLKPSDFVGRAITWDFEAGRWVITTRSAI